MSDETTGGTPTVTVTDPEVPTSVGSATATATTDTAAAAAPTPNGTASSSLSTPSESATASGAVDPMELAMQQMPPLDEIEVPGESSDSGGRGGRGGRGRDSRREQERDGLRNGQVVTGTVVHIDHEGVLVDVGTKTEGLIRPNELSREPVQNMEDVVKVGDQIEVLVLEDRPDGTLLLSKKRADFEKAWDKVQESLQNGETIQAMVSDRVKGGLVVDLGIRGFVPASHVGNGKLKNLEKFVGQSIPLKVLEVDRHNRKVVLSHRLATEEEREKQKVDTIGSLKEGQTRQGVVRRVTDYGAFVDLGGIDGLLHVSEMSWTRIKHPSDVVKVGQEIPVMILKLNLDQGRVSLGMRQILPDPWLTVGEKYHVNDVVEGEITRLVPFGAFVLLEGGIEGIIPNSELAHRRVAKPADVVEAGQQVQVKVIDVRAEERRLTLSLRALQPREPADDYRPAAPAAGPGGAPAAPGTTEETGRRSEKRERRGGRRGEDEGAVGGGDFRQYLSAGGGSGVTLGDMFGDLFTSSGRGGGKGGRERDKKRGGRRQEEDDEDLSDLDLDIDTDEETGVDAEGSSEDDGEA